MVGMAAAPQPLIDGRRTSTMPFAANGSANRLRNVLVGLPTRYHDISRYKQAATEQNNFGNMSEDRGTADDTREILH